MEDLYFSLDDLTDLQDCVAIVIESLQSRLPNDDNKYSKFNGIHVFKDFDDLPEDVQDEFYIDEDIQKLMKLYERLNVMVEQFIKEEELENQDLNNNEEVNDMKLNTQKIREEKNTSIISTEESLKDVEPMEWETEKPQKKISIDSIYNKCKSLYEYCTKSHKDNHCTNDEVNEEVEDIQEEFVEEVNEEVLPNDEVDEEVLPNYDEEEEVNYIVEMVDATMSQVVGQLEILTKILQDDGRCDLCGGYKVYDLNPQYYALLNIVGYGKENVCKCEYEVACEDEVCEPKPKKRRKGVRKQAPKKCNGNCANCKCHKNEEEEKAVELFQFIEDHQFDPSDEFRWFADVVEEEPLFEENVNVEDMVEVLQEDSEVELYYKLIYEEAAQYMLNRPVEVIWACAEGVEPPTKNEEDMGFDVRAHFDEDYMMFAPHETRLVPTGLYAAVPTLWGLLAREKGSTGAIGMKCGSGVIDSGYRGEIFIAITNENDCHLVITKDPDVKKAQKVEWVDWDNNTSFDAILYPYQKGIAQLLVKFNPKVETKVVSVDELKAIPSLRGDGKLGSTDNF